MLPNDPWLAQVREEALDPDLPIIDPHHHLWSIELAVPRRAYGYMPADLLADLDSGHNVAATVFVEARAVRPEEQPEHLRPVAETAWIVSAAEQFARERAGRQTSTPAVAAGIVAFADLNHPQAQEILEGHLQVAGGRLRGIRQSSTSSDDPLVTGGHPQSPPHRLLDPAFRRGFARLAPLDLCYDAWLYQTQLAELFDLAGAFPETTIVVDHLGGPVGAGRYAARREHMFQEWRQQLAELARCPNVFMKLGGTAMHLLGLEWEKQPRPPGSDELAAATGHFYHAAIDLFSPARCMFESNFPVDRERCSYGVLWNSFKKIAAPYSAAERAALFAGTAARVYKLTDFMPGRHS
jgi:predicted TIM-barrel fold metal-dependent hydrolase